MNFSTLKQIGIAATACAGFLIRETLASAATAIIQSPSLRKITVGVAATVYGSYCLRESAIFAAIRQMILGVPAGEGATPLSKDRLLLAASSTSVILLGLICVVSGVWDRLSPYAPLEEFLPSVSFQTEEDLKIVHQLEVTLLTCKEGEQLWQQVANAGNFSVLLADTERQAQWNLLTREITMARNVTSEEQKLFNLIHTLCEAKQDDFWTKTNELSINGKLNLNEFWKRIVTQMWHMNSCMHEVASACVKSHGWKPNIDYFKSMFTGPSARWRTIETMWIDLQWRPEFKSHRQYVMDFWQTNVRLFYCINNPKDIACRLDTPTRHLVA
jgi:hypothetical protein